MSYAVEWMPFAIVMGLVTLLFVPYLGLLIAFAILVLAAVTLVALARAVVAAPYLMIRRFVAAGRHGQPPNAAPSLWSYNRRRTPTAHRYRSPRPRLYSLHQLRVAPVPTISSATGHSSWTSTAIPSKPSANNRSSRNLGR